MAARWAAARMGTCGKFHKSCTFWKNPENRGRLVSLIDFVVFYVKSYSTILQNLARIERIVLVESLTKLEWDYKLFCTWADLEDLGRSRPLPDQVSQQPTSTEWHIHQILDDKVTASLPPDKTCLRRVPTTRCINLLQFSLASYPSDLVETVLKSWRSFFSVISSASVAKLL